MELAELIKLLRRTFWYTLAAALLAGAAAYFIHSRQPPIYDARATILIGNFLQSSNPTAAEIRTGVELANTYAQLVTGQTIMQGASEVIDGRVSPGEIRRMLEVSIIENTSLMQLTATSTDPELAAAVANAVAEQVVRNSPTNLTSAQQSQIDFNTAQIDRLNTTLENTESALQQVESAIATTEDADELNVLLGQRLTLIDQMTSISDTISRFSSAVATLQQRTNSIEVVETASPPTIPSGSSSATMAALAAVMAAALTTVVIIILNQLDDSLKSSRETAEILQLPVLGSVAKFSRTNKKGSRRLLTETLLRPATLESYHALRARLLMSRDAKGKAVYLITSPGPAEGKTMTAVNLAMTMALADLRVVLIDADLRRPQIHDIFGLSNNKGLASIPFNEPQTATSMADDDGETSQMIENLQVYLQPTDLPGLRVITSGTSKSNPTQILGTKLTESVATTLLSLHNTDVVIIDSAPCLPVADTSILATTTNVQIVLVVQAGRTTRSAAQKAKQLLRTTGRTIRGVVLNKARTVEEQRDLGYGQEYTRYYNVWNEPPMLEGPNGSSSEKSKAKKVR